jgi:hypothetical protein
LRRGPDRSSRSSRTEEVDDAGRADDKRERQYEHIKDQKLEQGVDEARAKEIAARTVNKDRAQQGESDQAGRASTDDVSPEHRGGKRSGNDMGPNSPTKDQLYEEARRRGVSGRSTMTKEELKDELGQG